MIVSFDYLFGSFREFFFFLIFYILFRLIVGLGEFSFDFFVFMLENFLLLFVVDLGVDFVLCLLLLVWSYILVVIFMGFLDVRLFLI